MARGENIVSVSFGDHLVFGEGDGRLATADALRRRVERWREELSASALHWRVLRSRLAGKFHAARGRRHPQEQAAQALGWDDLEVVPRLAHEQGMKAYLYLSVFDDGWALQRKSERAATHHNAMHGRDVSWQSELCREHPEYELVDRSGRRRQRGVLCLAFEEARDSVRERFLSLLPRTGFDGLFVCLRSQSRPPETADQFGYNRPVLSDFFATQGEELESGGGFDAQAWRDLLGGYVTRFLRELKVSLKGTGIKLAVGAPRGEVVGPPLGNWTLEWRKWVKEEIVDELVVGQDSTRCPSMWHDLWPMCESRGYVQNYRTGEGMPPLAEQLDSVYAPALEGSRTRLYVARQWDERSKQGERMLLERQAVSGLVFSSFRHDNPKALARGDWRA